MSMSRHSVPILVSILALSLGAFVPRAQAENWKGDIVYQWNQTAQQFITGQPFVQTRQYAMVHIAIADAVIAIQGRYRPYRVSVWAPRGASPEAAAAQAAHDVLVALYPAAQSTLDASLASSIAGIPPGTRASGVEVGRQVAARVLAWRQNDGFATANPQPPTISASTLPGIWRPTASGAAQYSALDGVTPFGLLTPTQFLPTAYPQLETDAYATDFDEVKSKGRSNSTTRSADQTRFAQLFAGVGGFANVTNAFRLWHNVARDVARQNDLRLVEAARLFALLAVSVHDSLQTSQVSKFVYRLWRPETAIAQAGVDNNPKTEAETPWAPLLPTPPYPSHSSNMACIGAGAARMLENVFGSDAANFNAIWYTGASPPAVVHSQPYTGFWDLAQDEGDSRVWGGIHFRFEIVSSQISCAQVADYVYRNRLKSLR